MAKTIKFNLIMDGNVHVRSIEGLQEAFCIDDVLRYFRNGLLERWLNARGFDKEFQEVKKIDRSMDDVSIVKQLIKTFDVKEEDEEITETIASLHYKEDDIERNEKYKENKFARNMIVSEYIKEYHQLLGNIQDHATDWALLKADIKELHENYIDIAKLLHINIFFYLKEVAPMAIIALLVFSRQSVFRKLWLTKAASIINTEICDMLKPDNASKILGGKLIVTSRNTKGNWYDAESDAEVAIIHLASNNMIVRNFEARGEELGREDINGNLPLLKGLQYKCSIDADKIYYIEV